MNPVGARGLVPPRPNLGPEPWSEAPPLARGLVVAGILIALFLGWLVWRRIGRTRALKRSSERAGQGPPDATPRGRLVAHSHSIRDVLAKHFGAAWRAKTTEELAADARLAEALGPDHLRELIRFLDQVDQLKFAPERSNHHHESLDRELIDWEPRLVELKKKIQAGPDGQRRNGAVGTGAKGSRARPAPVEIASGRSRKSMSGRGS